MHSAILEKLESENSEALTADGFEEALVGICTQFGRPSIAAYDLNKCIEILMSRDGMSREDALEYFEVNVIGSYVGDSTPCFVELFTKTTT